MAYAAVVSLIQNLEEILCANPPSLISLRRDQIESLRNEVGLLHIFLQDSSEKRHDKSMVKDLEIKIREAVYRVSDFIDSHVYISGMKNGALSEREYNSLSKIWVLFYQSFEQIMGEIKSVRLQVEKTSSQAICDEEVFIAEQFQSCPYGDGKLVGIDDDIKELLDRLTGPPSNLKIIPIVGMGGIGKTTLAARIYDDPLIVYHFYIRGWIRVSQGYSASLGYRVREMLLGLLQCFTGITDEILRMKNDQLGEKLYKTLKGMRYLIVLDDMWHTSAWDFLKRFFPDDGNRSRIILTSRRTDMNIYMSSQDSPHRVHFLKAGESWELLKSKLFVAESCPPELVNTGKQVAVKCQGLPLAVVVVAGILSKVSRTIWSWKTIEESLHSLVANEQEHCMDILALSYNYLPHHLKACFLYMGVFPEGYEIRVSRLIRLWIAEGFILPARGKCFEEVAEEYLEDLVNRNLIIAGKRRSNGRIKTCQIHDLLRDLCLKEGRNENFMHVLKRYSPIPFDPPSNSRRISLHASILHYFYSMHSNPLARSFLCFDVNKILPDLFLLEFMVQIDFKLLRVLDIGLVHSNHFPIEIVDLVNLRYLALTIGCEIPESISKLQKLQTLVIDHIWGIGQYLPQEIWKMSQLRHVHLKSGCHLLRPLITHIRNNSLPLLKNLQTLSMVMGPQNCSKAVFGCMTSLKKLEICSTETESPSGSEGTSECLTNLACLDHLEILKCSFLYRSRIPWHRLPQWEFFPHNLKKLALTGSHFPWKDMAILGMLPNLEVLKIKSNAFDGTLWEPVEGGFLQLKLLVIDNSDPMIWDADSSHFPCLKVLVLKECHRLREIPRDIGDITTLQSVHMHDCSIFVVNSAQNIHAEQKMLGNDELSVHITWG